MNILLQLNRFSLTHAHMDLHTKVLDIMKVLGVLKYGIDSTKSKKVEGSANILL